jgi:hypothetical protein
MKEIPKRGKDVTLSFGCVFCDAGFELRVDATGPHHLLASALMPVAVPCGKRNLKHYKMVAEPAKVGTSNGRI